MLDATGARRVHRTYSPFGATVQERGNYVWLPRHFAGHLEDAESGLVYMQARWMDAKSGTFLSIDPLVADASDPQSFNAYAYARNNPVSFVDPTGEAACSSFLIADYCGAEGGWLPPVWFAASPSTSDPGPTSMPLDSIGNPLSGGVQMGGGGAPPSQSNGGGVLATAVTIAVVEPTPIGEAALLAGAVGLTIYTGGVALVRGFQVLQQLGAPGRSIDNPSSLEGATPEEVEEAAREAGLTTKEPLSKGEGVKLSDPKQPGRQVRINQGTPGASGVHGGPYAAITGKGPTVRVPLKGNPTLK